MLLSFLRVVVKIANNGKPTFLHFFRKTSLTAKLISKVFSQYQAFIFQSEKKYYNFPQVVL